MKKSKIKKLMNFAILTGDLLTIERLIDAHGLNSLDKWSEGFTLLNKALQNERMEVATFLLTLGAAVNTTNTSTSTPLHHAIIANLVDGVEMLLVKGAAVNATDEIGDTPLHKGISRLFEDDKMIADHHKIIGLLLENGANVNATNHNGETPLSRLIQGRRSEEVRMLLAYCTNINFATPEGTSKFEGYTPLHHAVRNGTLDIVRLLIKNGADVNIGGKDGETALHIAANSGSFKIAEALIRGGANINAAFTSGVFEGCTPLHCAVSQKSEYCTNSSGEKEKVIEVLLSNSANVDAVSKNHGTPLHSATQLGCAIQVVELLLKNGADPNILNNNKTVLQVAVDHHRHEITKLLLKSCSNLNNEHHADILLEVVNKYSPSMLEELLKYGFSVAKHVNDADMFRQAMKKRDVNFVEELLKHGFEVNKIHRLKNGTSFMPLHSALQDNWFPEARLFIAYGADVNALDEAGQTAISNFPIKEQKPKFECGKSATFQMLELLLEKQANVRDRPDLLVSACKYDHWDIVELLLDLDVDVNGRDNNGVSALHLAVFRFCRKNQTVANEDLKPPLEILKLLLEKGADVNAKTNSNIAALHIASLLDPAHLEVLKILLKYNADVNVCCKNVTPLFICLHKNNVDFCQLLLECGANLKAKLDGGVTALQVAAVFDRRFVRAFREFEKEVRGFRKNLKLRKEFDKAEAFLNDFEYYGLHNHRDRMPELTKALIKFGAELNVKDDDGLTELHYAALNKETGDKIIELLIKHGSVWMCRNNLWETAFHLAARSSSTNVRTLVMFGADVNSLDIHGCSPLHKLNLIMRPGDILDLLSLGSDINILNNDGLTPLEAALRIPYSAGWGWRCEVTDVLFKHVVKLKAAKLYLHPKNLLALKDLRIDDWYDECKQELAAMKTEIIGETNMTYYNLLTSRRQEFFKLAKNKKLVEALEKGDFSDRFPNYCPILKSKVVFLKRALRRASLLKLCGAVFCTCIANLPDLCYDEIFYSFSDEDLENLVRAGHRQGVPTEIEYLLHIY